MGIDTDLNQSPYYDDFDETKNFHRVLFKPGVAVQARELTQLQSILQNQIERFGSNVLREGTIVSGCNINEIEHGFIKIRDLTTAGQPVSMNSYVNAKAIGVTTGVNARIQLIATGLETQSPDLNTLFVKYTDTGTSGAKVFSSTENIQIRNASTNELIATVTVAGNIDTSSVGKSYAVRIQDGVIYQKGHFIRVESQAITVSKYNTIPDKLTIGFQTVEEIVNSNNDTSLLDNASGYNNFNAPGADRLKLTATLVVKTLAEAEADEEFFAIQEYNLGKVVRRNRVTQYDNILKIMEERTKEESGNYVVKGLDPSVVPNLRGNNEILSVTVSRGTAYAEGKRVNILNTFDLDLNKSTKFETEVNQNVSQTIGNYILVDNFAGDFEPNRLVTATLYDANTGGSSIGTAKIKAIDFDNGTIGTTSAQYRMYLFNIIMNSGKQWTETKSIRYTGGSVSASAQLISTRRYDTSLSTAVYPLARDAVKKLPATGTSFDFVRRTQQDVILTNTNTSIGSIAANEWPYGDGTLSTQQKQELVLIPQTTNAAGGYTAGIPVNLSSATVTVSGSGTSMTISGLSAPDASVTFTLMHNEKLSQSAPAGKDLETIYVKIDTDTHINGLTGPWSLGVPDVYSIENIWVNNGSYAETNDKKNFFNLNSAREDAFYNLSSIKRKNITLSSGDNLLVKLKVFRKNTGGSNGPAVFTVDSYPIDDANTANTVAIQTQDIPLDRSDDGLTVIDLRNAVDLRQYAANTADYAATSGAATENPSSTVTFADTDQYTLAPNQYFETDYEYYLARTDFLSINEKGDFVIIEGTPSSNPAPPSEPTNGMVIARIEVSPYPSLDTKTARLLDKGRLGVRVVKRENKRYTMSDIAGIDRRIKNIEYYTSLNSLETAAKDLVITDVDGLDRFKNGIFADSFIDLSGSDIRNIEYSAAISPLGRDIQARTKMIPMDLTRKNASLGNEYIDVYPSYGITTVDETSTVAIVDQPYATDFRNCVSDFYKFNGRMKINPPYDSAFDTTAAFNVNFDVDSAQPIIDLVESINEYYPIITVDTETTSGSFLRTELTKKQWKKLLSKSGKEITTTTTTSGFQVNTQETTQSIGEFVTDVSLSPYIRPKTIYFVVFGLRPNANHYVYFDGVNVSQYCGVAESKDTSTLYDETARSKPVNDLTKFQKCVLPSEPGNIYGQLITDSNGTLRGFFEIPAETFYNGDRKIEIIDIDANTAELARRSMTSTSSTIYNAFNFSVNTSEVSMTTRTVESIDSKIIDVSTVVEVIPPPPPPSSYNPPGGDNDKYLDYTGVIKGTRDTPTYSSEQPSSSVQGGAGTNYAGDTYDANYDPEVQRARNGCTGGSDDPIAQTFNIKSNMTNDSIVMLSKMDLFFNRKDPNLGVTIQIRNAVNGLPGDKLLGEVHLDPDQVNANNTSANTATTIDFVAPIALSVNKEYCFTVLPDTNSPEYLIWTNKTGGIDVDTGLAVTQDSHDGTLFTSTNNRTWTPYQDENIKFVLYKGQYTRSIGGDNLKFKDPEFLKVEVVGNTLEIGKKVGLLSANAAGTLSVNAASKSVTGTSVDFAYLNENDWIAYYANTTVIDIAQIANVDAANNQITLVNRPRFSNTAVNYFKTTQGDLAYFDGTDKYVLEYSSASTGTTTYDNGSSNTTINNYFTANDTVFSAGSVGPITGTITEVVDQNLSYIQPNIYKTESPKNSIPFYIDTVRNTLYTNYLSSNRFIKTNDVTYFNTTKSIVPSLSNMKANSVSGEQFQILYNPRTRSIDSTPVVDYEISNCFINEYIINNDVTNEEDPTQLGNAQTRWISTTATLADGFDSDDIALYITAYRPPTTDIKVYVKFQNGTDPRDLDDVYWTQLQVKTGLDEFSSTTNLFDYRELEYVIPSVANAAALTNGGAAALLEDNEYNLYYKDANGTLYSKYNTFKIKVVMTSADGHKLSPRMKDIRAIALS